MREKYQNKFLSRIKRRKTNYTCVIHLNPSSNPFFLCMSDIFLWVFEYRQRNYEFLCVLWISLWVFTQPTKKILIFLCVHNFPSEVLNNLQARVNFPVCSVIPLWVFRQATRKIEFSCGFLEKHSGKFGTHREKRFQVVKHPINIPQHWGKKGNLTNNLLRH